MLHTTDIHEHMEVIGSDGTHVGTVDRVEGQTIKLTRSDPNSGGLHHWIPVDWIDHVDSVVHLNKNRDEAVREWHTAAA